MSKVWKPSASECALIRECASVEVGMGPGALMLEVGVRANSNAEESMNEYVINPHRILGETDLSDFCSWADFKRQGVELTAHGDAEIDFYVRPKSSRISEDALLGNIIVIVKGGEIKHILGCHRNGADRLPWAKARLGLSEK